MCDIKLKRTSNEFPILKPIAQVKSDLNCIQRQTSRLLVYINDSSENMKITGKILHDKIRNLDSEFSNGVTPEILDKICNEPSVQPFLKWFCDNVNYDNVLSNEEIEIKNRLQETKEWIEGPELDSALEEATKNDPHLLNIISFNAKDKDDLFAEYEMMNNMYKENTNYIRTLQNGIKNLKKLEVKLDEDMEEEEESLNMEYIKADKAYKDCSKILKQFDEDNREFFEKVKCLLNIYTDAAENKGTPLLWTQMPLDLAIKKIELYHHYLDIHIRRQLGNENCCTEEQKTDSDYVSLINNGKESSIDNEKLQELMLCKTNLNNAKMEAILAKVQEDSFAAMLDSAQDIYNSENLKVPRQSEIRREILALSKRKDLLEENVCLLQECQLTEVVQQFAELEIMKVQKQDAHKKLEQRKTELVKLKNLRFLAREDGHVPANLLSMLMQMQFQRLKDVSEFVADVQHYLTTEYLLSSTRCESMQQQQTEYSAIVSSSKVYNSFDKLLISMIFHNEHNSCQLPVALDKYNELIDENRRKKKLIIETSLNSKIHKLETLQSEVNQQYTSEIQKGPTYTFKPIPYKIETCYNETSNNLQKIQTDLMKIRNQMKERMKIDTGFEREKDILWQRFLADANTLKQTHKEIKQMISKSCFEKYAIE